jgi:hypothetical protein
MKVLHRLADERLTDDRAPDEVRMAQVKPSVEDSQLDAGAASWAWRNFAGDQTPGCAQNLRIRLCFRLSLTTTQTQIPGDGLRRSDEAPQILTGIAALTFITQAAEILVCGTFNKGKILGVDGFDRAVRGNFRESAQAARLSGLIADKRYPDFRENDRVGIADILQRGGLIFKISSTGYTHPLGPKGLHAFLSSSLLERDQVPAGLKAVVAALERGKQQFFD